VRSETVCGARMIGLDKASSVNLKSINSCKTSLPNLGAHTGWAAGAVSTPSNLNAVKLSTQSNLNAVKSQVDYDSCT